ncbi:MAG: magnesium transporter [Candidatus Aenigmarchaeota archaeon]|nr:magnesium transporter [Candidatus Aenigmarchaeota archaeon]
MKNIRPHLEKLRKVSRKKYHPLIHKLHKKHKISKKTLFYVKEYGPHSNVPRTIIKESIKILLLASIISSFGGFALEHIKTVFVSIVPLIILMPTLNDMIGDYGTILSSKFSTMLYEGKVSRSWWKNTWLRKLFVQIFIISMFTTIMSSALALVISIMSGYSASIEIALKIYLICLIDVAIFVSILFLISVYAGFYFFRKKEDPNNFLIPITTSIADFGNMIILSLLIMMFF